MLRGRCSDWENAQRQMKNPSALRDKAWLILARPGRSRECMLGGCERFPLRALTRRPWTRMSRTTLHQHVSWSTAVPTQVVDFCLLMTQKKALNKLYVLRRRGKFEVFVLRMRAVFFGSRSKDQWVGYVRQIQICSSGLFLQLTAGVKSAQKYTQALSDAIASPLTFLASHVRDAHAQTCVTPYRWMCFCFQLDTFGILSPFRLLVRKEPRLIYDPRRTFISPGLFLFFPLFASLPADWMSIPAVQEAEKYRMYTLPQFGKWIKGTFCGWPQQLRKYCQCLSGPEFLTYIRFILAGSAHL